MYLLYLDESGFAQSNDQQYYVLGGVAAEEKRPFHLCRDLDDLQKKLFPASADPIEFHASAIRNQKGSPWDSMRRDQCKQAIDQVLAIIAGSSVVLFGVAILKSAFPGVDPVHRTCEEMAGHFDAYLQRLEIERNEKQRGLLVFDQTNQAQKLHSLVNDFRTAGASWGGRIRHLAEIPMFTDSRLTRMLQLADFVAYAVFRYYEHGDASMFNQIATRFDQAGGQVHGIVHLCTRREDCLCPGCLSRRAAKAQSL